MAIVTSPFVSERFKRVYCVSLFNGLHTHVASRCEDCCQRMLENSYILCVCIYMSLRTLSVQQDVIHLILCLPFGINAGICISVLMWEHGIFDMAKFSTLMSLSLRLSCKLCSELLVLKYLQCIVLCS